MADTVRNLGADRAVLTVPRAFASEIMAALTEYRAGTDVYNHRNTVRAGAATRADYALTAQATVISRPAPDRAVTDAGSKTPSSTA